MSAISFTKVSVTFGERTVLNAASFSLPAGLKVGLTGENGSGKSTILRLIAGELAPDDGLVTVPADGLTYVPQHATALDAPSALSAVLDGRPRLGALYHRLLVTAPDGDDEDALAYADLVAQYSALGGYECESDARRSLYELGLADEVIDRPPATLSGGECARVVLARALLSAPRMLLLDEPDSHLDLPGVNWLEDRLKRFGGGLVLVSHDRDLLEAATGAVLEIEDGRTTLEHGALSEYLQRKEQRLAQQVVAYQQQQRKVEQLEQDIRRLKDSARGFETKSQNDHWRRIGKKVAQTAKARQHRLERELAGVNRVERPRKCKRIALTGDGPERTAGHVLVARELAKGFGGRELFSDVDLELKRGQRLAVTGRNGSGKTTLLEVLIGRQAAGSGEIWRSPGAEVYYCDQLHAGLDPAASAYDVLAGATGLSPNQVYYTLAQLNLKNRNALKPVGTLSGGERTRLVLAVMLNARADLLVLDEPTNHLDLPSIEVLEQALCRFTGAVLVVSHDRRFIRRVATEVVKLG